MAIFFLNIFSELETAEKDHRPLLVLDGSSQAEAACFTRKRPSEFRNTFRSLAAGSRLSPGYNRALRFAPNASLLDFLCKTAWHNTVLPTCLVEAMQPRKVLEIGSPPQAISISFASTRCFVVHTRRTIDRQKRADA